MGRGWGGGGSAWEDDGEEGVVHGKRMGEEGVVHGKMMGRRG